MILSEHTGVPTQAGSRSSLRNRLLITFGLILLIALLAVGAGVIVFVLRGEEQSWRDRQEERARAAAALISGFLEQTRTTLALVGALETPRSTSTPEVLRAVLMQHPELLEVVRLDQRGSLLMSAAQGDEVLANIFTVAQSVWFRSAVGGDVYYSEVQLSAQSEPYLIVAVPDMNSGVVAARLRLTVLETLVTQASFGPLGQTYVVNRSGQVIAHSEREVVLDNTNLSSRPEVQLTPVNADPVRVNRYVNFQGTPVLGVTSALPDSDWLLVNEVSQAEASALSRTAFGIFGIGVVLLGLVLLASGAFQLNQLVVQPIERLRLGATQIASGAQGYRIAVRRRDEVGQVAEAFNQMAQAVEERAAELAQLAASLEQAVDQRTAELRREIEERGRLEEETLRQAAILREIATPVIPIDDYTLVMPLVGALDSRRISQIQDTLLHAAEQNKARVVILDVTGVPVIDSQVAAALVGMSDAVRLLGARVVLTGIRPEIAQALVTLGLDLSGLTTRASLQSGIEYALRFGLTRRA